MAKYKKLTEVPREENWGENTPANNKNIIVEDNGEVKRLDTKALESIIDITNEYTGNSVKDFIQQVDDQTKIPKLKTGLYKIITQEISCLIIFNNYPILEDGNLETVISNYILINSLGPELSINKYDYENETWLGGVGINQFELKVNYNDVLDIWPGRLRGLNDLTSASAGYDAANKNYVDTKQAKTLDTPLTIGGTQYTTVESALAAIVAQLS